MCGIAGILTADGGGPDVGPRIEAMQRALAHRGPDDRGGWRSPGGHAALAHTRLAILDPTPAGRQPMSIDSGRLTITFNGAIYNFLALRRELEQHGAPFRSRTDTEVVLRAYDAYGVACVERLRGMFAFAIWDERNQSCLLARDRMGIKPLYYAEQPGRLIFASELRAIVAAGQVPRVVDARAVYDYFRAGSVQEPRTLLSGVRCLEAGQAATWQDGRLRGRRYWDLSFEPSLPAVEAIGATRAALIDSVALHFVSDTPVGIFLSGGVDSTALLALAHHAGRRDVRVLTMAMPGAEQDELALARRTATHFGARQEVCTVDAETGRALFAECLRTMDQPSIDGMNTLAVSKLAQACGLKVMLSGLGADELFGGYPSVRRVPGLAAWHRRIAATGGLGRAAGALLARAADSRWRRIGDLLGQEPGLAAAYAAYRGIYTRTEARRLAQHYCGRAPGIDEADDMTHDDSSAHDAVCRLEMTRYMRNQLLRDTDAMSMACGVEVRLPFLDARVVDTVTAIDWRDRLKPAKDLLIRAVPEIPAWIARQPKRGFMFPVETWWRGPWQGTFDGVRVDSPVPAGTWYRSWCVRALDAWLNGLRSGEAVQERPAPVVARRGMHG